MLKADYNKLNELVNSLVILVDQRTLLASQDK